MRQIEAQKLEITKRFEENFKSLNLSIRDLREQKLGLETYIDEMKIEMEQLTRFDKRKGAMTEVEETYENHTYSLLKQVAFNSILTEKKDHFWQT